jgi:hypothetical protein
MTSDRSKVVDRLQRISRERDESANRVVEAVMSAPYSLECIGFSLVELFPSEVRGDVIDGARGLFPFMDYERYSDTRSKWFGSFGRIYRTRPEGFFLPPDSVTYLRTLPTWIAFIDVSIVDHGPSAFMVVANVVTNEHVDTMLRRRMETRARHTVELLSMRRLSRLGYSFSRTNEATAYANAFQAELGTLRSVVQRAVFDRLSPRGYFRSHESTMPALEFIRVSGGDALVEDWVTATRAWLWSLGFKLDRDYYAGESVILSVPRDFDARYPPVWRVAFRPSYKPPVVGSPDESRSGIAIALHENMYQTLEGLAVTAHHEILASMLQRFRRKVYLSQNRRFDIAGQVRLYEEILEERTFFLRTKRDFEDQGPYSAANAFLHPMRNRTAFLPNQVGEQPGDENLRGRLRWMYDLLTEGIDDVHKSYSDVLAARNWRATNRLSTRAVWISSASVIVAVLSVMLRSGGVAPAQWQWPHRSGVGSSSPVPTASPVPRMPTPKVTQSPRSKHLH